MSDALIGMTLDCSDLDIVFGFWRRALGYAERSGGAAKEAAFRTLFAPSDRSGLHHLTIQQVPELKTTKNRAHLDLFVEDVEAEVERLRMIGATVLRDAPLPDDVHRTFVLADPEGNEFCVVQRPPR